MNFYFVILFYSIKMLQILTNYHAYFKIVKIPFLRCI